MNSYIALKEYLAFLKNDKNISSSSIKDYENDIKLFYGFLKDCPNTEDFKYDDLNRFIAHQTSLGLSSATLLRRISTISSFLKFLKGENIISYEIYDIPKISIYRDFPDYLTEDEIKKLFDYKVDFRDVFGFRNKAMITLCYASGLRVNELLDLKRNEINKTSFEVNIKRGMKRKIPTSREACIFIKQYQDKLRKRYIKPKDNYLFVNYKGEKISRQSFFNDFKDMLKKCGIDKDVSPSALRHSFAVHLINAGCDLGILQAMLGHTKYSTTELYAEIGSKKIVDIYDKFFK